MFSYPRVCAMHVNYKNNSENGFNIITKVFANEYCRTHTHTHTFEKHWKTHYRVTFVDASATTLYKYYNVLLTKSILSFDKGLKTRGVKTNRLIVISARYPIPGRGRPEWARASVFVRVFPTAANHGGGFCSCRRLHSFSRILFVIPSHTRNITFVQSDTRCPYIAYFAIIYRRLLFSVQFTVPSIYIYLYIHTQYFYQAPPRYS